MPRIPIIHPRQVRKRAFTLIELLVVMSIVAMLFALLLPSLARSRSVARTVMCSSNIRSMGYSMYSYATMYKDGVVPSLQPGFNIYWWAALNIANEIDMPRITVQTDPPISAATVFKCPEAIMDYAWNDSAHTYSTSNWDHDNTYRMFRCRVSISGNVFYWDSSYSSMNVNGDFNINLPWMSLPCHAIPNGASNANSPSDPYTLVKVSNLKTPSKLVFLFDGVESQWLGGLSARHNNATDTNVLFYDGHASSYACNTDNFPNTHAATYLGIGKPVAGAFQNALTLANLKNFQTMQFRNDQ